MESSWTVEELRREFERFRIVLQSAGLRSSTMETYVGRSTTFVDWLAGDYQPRGPVGS